jgi:hypothetical protein
VGYEGATRPLAAQQPDNLDALFDDLSRGVDVDTAAGRIENDLRLSVESFNRLMEIWRQARRWERSPTLEPVSEAAWREVRSILVQAQKAAWFSGWIQEERNASISFDSATFWTSLREPVVGDWPPPSRQPPLVDPDASGRDELPDLPFGRERYPALGRPECLAEDEAWLVPSAMR